MGKKIPFVFEDGGRAKAQGKWPRKDCVIRSLAILVEEPYDDLYREFRKAQRLFDPERPITEGIINPVVTFVYRKRGLMYHSLWPKHDLSFRQLDKEVGKCIVRCAPVKEAFVTTYHGQEVLDVQAMHLGHVTCIKGGCIQDVFDPQLCTDNGRFIVLGYYS